MHNNTVFPKITVTKKQERNVRNGSLWVYEDEITGMDTEPRNGSIVDVMSMKGTYLGSGLWSAASKIRVRLLGDNPNETYEEAFWVRRVNYALAYRKQVMGEDFRACRLIHGEADGLPGVTVDRYEDVLVSEIQSFGMEQRKEMLYQALLDAFAQDGLKVYIYERNEGELRRKEGLEQTKGWYTDPGREKVIIDECGIRYEVDIVNGQKTGFFLDQKYNRLSVRSLCRGLKVLDCCTHTGAFALNAVKGGAAEVTAIDISAAALEEARRNAELNGMQEKVRFIEADVFAFLDEALEHRDAYDLIVLDPPAFTKSRSSVHNARAGYRRINAQAMRILKRGGYLVTNSCSHFMTRELFMEMLRDAANDASRDVRIVKEDHAAADHPVRLKDPSGDYLKFFVLQIV
ncbi:MAG: class I SAM-dependent rRNA methyltransferase [Solobacterium sp.]|nr:class I SAM-dependent rRNA methyltransferase [Solobacterium sp.]